MAGGAQAIFKSAVNCVLKLVGGHVLHLLEKPGDRLTRGGPIQLLGRDRRLRRTGENIDPRNVMLLGRNAAATEITNDNGVRHRRHSSREAADKNRMKEGYRDLA